MLQFLVESLPSECDLVPAIELRGNPYRLPSSGKNGLDGGYPDLYPHRGAQYANRGVYYEMVAGSGLRTAPRWGNSARRARSNLQGPALVCKEWDCLVV